MTIPTEQVPPIPTEPALQDRMTQEILAAAADL